MRVGGVVALMGKNPGEGWGGGGAYPVYPQMGDHKKPDGSSFILCLRVRAFINQNVIE